MRRQLRSILIATAFSLAVMSAATVFAAPVTWDQVDVTLHPGQADSILLVSGELPENASLPAEGELSVPAGAELQWIGEILGGDPAADPELKYTKETANGVDVYKFTLTKARMAQVEVLAPVMGFDGTTFTPAIAWKSAQDIPAAQLTIRVPQNAQLAETPEGVTPQPGPEGYALYSKTVKNVKAGDELDLAFAYTLTAAPPAAAGTTPASSQTPTLGILLGAIGVAAVALFVFSRRKTAPLTSDEAAADDEPRANTVDASDDEESAQGTAGGTKGSTKRKVVTAVIIGAFILGVVVVGGQATKPKATGDTYSQTFGPGDPCATANIVLAVPAGASPATTAESLFGAIRPITGLTTATYNAKTSTIQIGYCDSTSSEAALRDALAPTGFLAPGGVLETTTAP